jgi:hypothetical protein
MPVAEGEEVAHRAKPTPCVLERKRLHARVKLVVCLLKWEIYVVEGDLAHRAKPTLCAGGKEM